MSVTVSSAANGVGLTLIAYQNCDDVQLFWRSAANGQKDVSIPGCLGFMIERQRKNDDGNWKAHDIKDHIKELEEPLRRFLSGELRLALLRLLDEAIEDMRLEIYAALYELTDQELIDRLKLLRGRAHVVLANGSDKKGDGNEDAREELKKAKVEVFDRILGSKGLGHNKFVVTYRQKDKTPLKAWTGSTNWAATGLCTQANNGLLISDTKVAQEYFDQWHRLVDAGDDFPDDLMKSNAASPHTVGNVGIWSARPSATVTRSP